MGWDEPIETVTYKRCTIELHRDDDPTNPREWDNVGTMLCIHRDYNLGDEQDHKLEPEEIIAITERKDVIWMPLYLYDHSGITIRAGMPHGNWTSSKGRFTGDSAGWDTSTVGIVYCTREKALEEWGGKSKRLTKTIVAKAIKCMQGEVETYAAYLEGDVRGYITKDEDGEEIDACWGYFPDGDYKKEAGFGYMMDDARGSIDHYRTEKLARLKAERAAAWEHRQTTHFNRANALAML